MNGEVRAARESVRPKITQEDLARELGTTRARIIDHEVWGKPLPRRITPSDAIDAIERIKARRNEAQQ